MTEPSPRSVPRPAFLILIFAVFAALLIVASVVRTGGDGTVPGPYGDTQDYDGIAFQLMRGRGFGIDYSDAEWRRPYELHNEEGDYDELLSRRTPFALSTYRPPLLPYALAVVYRVFGHNFLVWRIIEALLTALAIALVCDAAWRTFGSGVALMSAALMFVSQTYVRYVAVEAVMTEPLAMVTAALLLWMLVRLCEKPRMGYAIGAGLAFALLCLARTFYIGWLPFLVVFVWWIGRRSFKAAALFGTVAVVLQIPWAIRNIRVTGAFMPFGTQAGVAVYTGYSDLAVSHRGIWWMAPGQPERAYARELGGECSGCDSVALARYEMRGARIWVGRNVRVLPKLAWWKVANTVIFADEAGMIAPVFWLALAAPLVLWRRRADILRPAALVFGAFVVLTFVVIAVTWAMGWRFIVPVEPILTVLAAIPLAAWVFGESSVAADPDSPLLNRGHDPLHACEESG